jgi:hypothetical protein
MTALFRPKFSITEVEYIRNNIREKYKFKEFDDKACMSTSFYRFKRELGMPDRICNS